MSRAPFRNKELTFFNIAPPRLEAGFNHESESPGSAPTKHNKVRKIQKRCIMCSKDTNTQ